MRGTGAAPPPRHKRRGGATAPPRLRGGAAPPQPADGQLRGLRPPPQTARRRRVRRPGCPRVRPLRSPWRRRRSPLPHAPSVTTAPRRNPRALPRRRVAPPPARQPRGRARSCAASPRSRATHHAARHPAPRPLHARRGALPLAGRAPPWPRPAASRTRLAAVGAPKRPAPPKLRWRRRSRALVEATSARGAVRHRHRRRRGAVRQAA
mmetsp:Transcript_49252/g.159636  ORF Transcript_49252/g.159636 Transcript_49252/m.159636 type:complete len:208 (+) Transcript_49252:2520-3143(+)